MRLLDLMERVVLAARTGAPDPETSNILARSIKLRLDLSGGLWTASATIPRDGWQSDECEGSSRFVEDAIAFLVRDVEEATAEHVARVRDSEAA